MVSQVKPVTQTRTHTHLHTHVVSDQRCEIPLYSGSQPISVRMVKPRINLQLADSELGSVSIFSMLGCMKPKSNPVFFFALMPIDFSQRSYMKSILQLTALRAEWLMSTQQVLVEERRGERGSGGERGREGEQKTGGFWQVSMSGNQPGSCQVCKLRVEQQDVNSFFHLAHTLSRSFSSSSSHSFSLSLSHACISILFSHLSLSQILNPQHSLSLPPSPSHPHLSLCSGLTYVMWRMRKDVPVTNLPQICNRRD